MAVADAGSPDAALVPQEMGVDDWDIQTCAAGCAAFRIGCAARCQFGATFAAYGHPDQYGFLDAVKTVEEGSCDVAVPAEAVVDGATYPRALFACCCMRPEVTVVPGDVATRPACADVCAAAGFDGCGDFYDWQGGGTNGLDYGGVLMRYVRQSTGSSYYLISSCAHTPSATINAAGAERTLDTYDCACI